MDILIGLGSVIFSLFITVLSVKLVAGWLNAERNGWGRCFAALLLSYVVAAMIAGGGAIAATFLPDMAGLVVVIVAVIAAIGAPIVIFARLLGTSGLRAFAILLIATVVNMAIIFGIGIALVTVLGIGLAGLGAMIGMGELMPGMDSGDGEALARFERGIDQLCECTEKDCVDAIVPELMDDMMVALESRTLDTDPAEQARFEALSELMDLCQEFDDAATPEPAAPDTAFTPAPKPAPAPTDGSAPRPVYYALRDVAIADAPAHIGKLVRVTLADGSRERNRLVVVEGGSITLKRDKSEGGGHYSIALSEIVRMEVFDR
ncbi:MAG: hypothetical protein O7B81_03390 [Gammaproteobacteria bacterium]|nr:hypothetical protein [Gammaproteobacteria bacterium]